MIPAVALLAAMRARGQEVRREGSKLVVEGPTPKDPERAARLVRERKAELLAVLEAEAHPLVLAALDAFPGARLTDVLQQSSTERYPAELFGAWPAAEQETKAR